MKYSREVKVGVSIVLAALIFYFGVRYLQNVPLFRGSYTLHAQFSNAGGLVSGNQVRINGVNVGSVESVRLDPEARVARVVFRVDRSIKIPQGSTAEVSGVSALGGVRLSISLGPPSNPPIEPGGFVPTPPEKDIFAQLSDKAPLIAARADSLLAKANTTMEEANVLLQSPESNFNTTMDAVRESATALARLLESQRARLGRVLENTEGLTAELESFAETNTDSLNQSVEQLNTVLTQAERNLQTLDRTTRNLDVLVTKINEGEGTLGRLVNDPGLYMRLDSTTAQFNQLLKDFQANPGRYLKDMSLVKVF